MTTVRKRVSSANLVHSPNQGKVVELICWKPRMLLTRVSLWLNLLTNTFLRFSNMNVVYAAIWISTDPTGTGKAKSSIITDLRVPESPSEFYKSQRKFVETLWPGFQIPPCNGLNPTTVTMELSSMISSEKPQLAYSCDYLTDIQCGSLSKALLETGFLNIYGSLPTSLSGRSMEGCY